jgi:hypothetical protein
MEKGKVFDQHLENSEFFGKLTFYKDEIKILQNRLDEVAAKNNQSDCMKDVEHFQNQLIIQKNNIDEIKHKVVLDEDRLMKEIEKNEVAIDHRSVEFHSEEKEAVETFERIFNDFRKEINLFFTKWM